MSVMMLHLPQTESFFLFYFEDQHGRPSPASAAQQLRSPARLHPHPSDPRGRRGPNDASHEPVGLRPARSLRRASAAVPSSPSDGGLAQLPRRGAASQRKGFPDRFPPTSRRHVCSPAASRQEPLTR